MATFLRPDEIETLTGKTQKAAQVRWLQTKGYYFEVNGRGEILVTREYVNARFAGVTKNTVQPNWGAL